MIYCLYFLIISTVLLTGCTKEQNVSGHGSKQNVTDKSNKENIKKNIIAPINISNGQFGQVVGWVNNETIVYVNHSQQSSSVFTYNLYSGNSIKVFDSDGPISSVYISSTGERILIHSSTSNVEGKITVIDPKGRKLVSKTIHSSELTIAWNSFNENFVLVTAFNDQWEYTVSILNIEKKELTNTSITKQPFAHWLTKDELVYLDWDLNSPAFFAPVVKQEMEKDRVDQLDIANVFQLYTFHDVLLTVSVDMAHEEEAIYTFQSNRFQPLFSLSMPQLTRFSDWLVPYHAYNTKKGQFITLRPISSGSVESYTEGFQLVSYPTNGEKEKVILEGLENKPLSLSPDGELCLYGYQLETLIALDSGEMVPLVESVK